MRIETGPPDKRLFAYKEIFMKLEKLTDRIFFCPHETSSDRPMLAYVRGDKFALAIDAGYSEQHMHAFYGALQNSALPMPDFTVLTHWHFDHTLGMCAAAGLTVASEKTAAYLKTAQKNFLSPSFTERLRREDKYFAMEYADSEPCVALPDICFHTKMQIDLGGITAKLFCTVSPHTDDSTCIYIQQENTLFLGDSACEDVYNGEYLDKVKLRALAETVRDIPCRLCILSHEPPLTKEDFLASVEEELQ